ncbi:hypothetical protein CFREI_05765 [Corynebacterium freiburgense]|nr:hypothetical protein CFREI_05765 [Corynebacterium freiburgense]
METGGEAGDLGIAGWVHVALVMDLLSVTGRETFWVSGLNG